MSEFIIIFGSLIGAFLFAKLGYHVAQGRSLQAKPYVKITEHSSQDGKLIRMHYEGPLDALAAARKVRDGMKDLS
jgi:hypothetical protein